MSTCFDSEKLAGFLNGDFDLLAELVNVFEEDLLLCLPQLHQAVQSSQIDLVERLIHRIQGQVNTFFAMDLVEYLRSLEREIRQSKQNLDAAALNFVDAHLKKLLQELKAHMVAHKYR